MKKRTAKIEAQIEKEFSQIDPKLSKRSSWKWEPREGPRWNDDSVLDNCIFQFDEALKDGATREGACSKVISYALKAVEEMAWPKENCLLLWEAVDRNSKRAHWLTNLAEMVNPDTIHGKNQKAHALRGWKIAVELQRQEREPVWNRWQTKANEIWCKHPEWSKRRVAIEIRKTEPDTPAVTTITQRIKK